MSNAPQTPANPGENNHRSSFIHAIQLLAREVFRLNGQLLATGDHLSKDIEVSTARWQVMATIRAEAATVADISRRLGLRRQSVQETVNRLQQQDLIELDSNPHHVRASLVRLTAQGHEIIEVLRRRQLRVVKLFMQELDLSADDLYVLTRQLREVRETAELIAAHDFMMDDDRGR